MSPWRMLAVLALAGAVLCGAASLQADEAKPASAAAPDFKSDAKKAAEDYELYKVLVDTLDQVERNYVQNVSRREIIEAAIKGVLAKLDPYSNYISPDELGRFKTSVENQFGGIGIQIDMEDGVLKVLSPLVGTPAYRAGILAGDRIIAIEGESTEGLIIDDAVRKLKGEPGSSVKLTVVHAHNNKRLEATLQREVIHLQTVLGAKRQADDEWSFVIDDEHKIGYVRLTAFSRETTKELTAVLDQLKQQGMKALVLDLRFNPGGLLTSAIEISDLFLKEGRIVSTAGRNSPERVWDAKAEGTYDDFPMAVLVNHSSASASEIVAAALQDHGRAVVVGQRTWGKGSVQNVIELEGGKSALKLTTAGYVRPSGKNIHRMPNDDDEAEWGVKPSDGFDVELNRMEALGLWESLLRRNLAHGREEILMAEATPDAATKQPASDASATPNGKPTGAAEETKPESAASPKPEQPVVQPVEGTTPPEATPSETPAADAPTKSEALNESTPADATPTGDVKPAETKAQPDANERPADPHTAAAAQAAGGPFVDRQLQRALEHLRLQLRMAKAA